MADVALLLTFAFIACRLFMAAAVAIGVDVSA